MSLMLLATPSLYGQAAAAQRRSGCRNIDAQPRTARARRQAAVALAEL